ncbi:MAG: aldehyde ferredoxin oxidoreductase [Deltaproteobacteria bacterium]|nr:aldehyde ferredoxin oxidoreductase [Deltaproteobacteria bacterium]
MDGWTGKILHIDLTRRTHSVERPSPALYETWIGGKGLAGHYLAPHITEKWDTPSMPLLFFTGPLVGTPSPTSGRMTIMSRSPLTGTVGDASVGGRLGTTIKQAGWDGIVITGKSSALCGIVIGDDEKITFTDAEKYRGMETGKIFAALGKEGGSAVTGPAAESGVLFANIVVDRRYFAGRSGLGLVMAAKNLKYLHVTGTGKNSLFDREEVMHAREEILRLAAASPILQGEFGITRFGTGALYDLMHNRRMMPTRNFRATRFENAGKMNAWHYRERYGYRKTGCRGCHILCKKNNRKGEELPEFETMSHFSALIDNHDLDTVVEANRTCNETGMDTITAAATLACYAEIEDVTLTPSGIIDLLRETAAARGIGAELAQGSFRYAKTRGRAECAMTVKGSELPAYDPRGVYGMALAYATSTRGGCHLRAYPISYEILRKPVAMDRFDTSGKARVIKISEDQNAVIDSLTACKFLFFAASLEEYARALSGVTGIPTTAQDLLKVGERIYYHERLMNAANGFTADDDDLPRRFFTEGGTGGEGMTIPPIDREAFLHTRSNYYRIRGLDKKGCPTREKCEELGIEWKNW